ncbi:MAG: 50S ribosomal protein L11 methyltransferase [Mariniphaga sp.]|nr:50S ribosomal protein L11 methyltransferase [Mariniphaga sp.]
MDYLKISIETIPFFPWSTDSLSAQLNEIGFESFIETETGLEAYIQEKNYNQQKLEELLSEQTQNIQINWSHELIKSQNWNEVWEKNYFKPLVIKDTCVVRAPFHNDYPKCKYEIIIEPNMAFGTGNHETTSMMIEFLLKENMVGKEVLDMGCGTGILSIMASMLGAKKITAIDIDKWSFDATKTNAQLNNINNIEAFQGDSSLLKDQKSDVILANIQRNVLLADMEKYVSVLKSEGILVMSGFYIEDIPVIKEKAENLNLKDIGYNQKNNWVAHAFKK